VRHANGAFRDWSSEPCGETENLEHMGIAQFAQAPQDYCGWGNLNRNAQFGESAAQPLRKAGDSTSWLAAGDEDT
jgi:hypothetical protein